MLILYFYSTESNINFERKLHANQTFIQDLWTRSQALRYGTIVQVAIAFKFLDSLKVNKCRDYESSYKTSSTAKLGGDMEGFYFRTN